MFLKMFASGTNIQRQAKAAGRADGVLFSAYSQLEASNEPGIIKRRFYRTNILGAKADVEAMAEELQPTWAKIWARPDKSVKFISTLIRHLTGEHDGRDNRLNLTCMLNTETPVQCFMLLTSAEKKGMAAAARFMQAAIPDWEILVLNGDFTNNKKAEKLTKERLADVKRDGKKGLIIVTNQMGSRSYSISEIQATVIAYDRGSVDATDQKASRALTPGFLLDGSVKQHGMIVDLSFDPNRAENIELLVLNEIINVQKNDGTDTATAAKKVLNTINLFTVDAYGDASEVSIDDLMKIYTDQDNLLKIADVTADHRAILEFGEATGLIDVLANIKSQDKPSAKKDVLGESAKSFIREHAANPERQPTDKEQKDLEALLNRAIRALNMSATSVAFMAPEGDSFRSCLKSISDDEELDEEFLDLFGVYAGDALAIVEHGFMNEMILDILVFNSKKVDSPFTLQ